MTQRKPATTRSSLIFSRRQGRATRRLVFAEYRKEPRPKPKNNKICYSSSTTDPSNQHSTPSPPPPPLPTKTHKTNKQTHRNTIMFRRLADRFNDAVASATTSTEQQHINTLKGMGFTESAARAAYQACGGNVEHAAEQLLSNGPGGGGGSNGNGGGSASTMAMDLTPQHQEDDDLQRALEASLQVQPPTASSASASVTSAPSSASASSVPIRSAASRKAGQAALSRFEDKNSTTNKNNKKTLAKKRSASPKSTTSPATAIATSVGGGGGGGGVNPLLVPSHPGVKVPAKLSDKSKEEQILRTADRLKSYPAAVDTLYKALKGLQSNPNDPKFQQIDQSNAGYQKSLAPAPGALDLLLAMNYRSLGGGVGGIGMQQQQRLVLDFYDPATIYLGISALEQIRTTSTEYQQQKAILQMEKEIDKIQQLGNSSVDEAISRANFMAKCPSEPSIGRGSLMTIQLTSNTSIQRRFDGDDTLQDVLHWLGGHGTELYQKLIVTPPSPTTNNNNNNDDNQGKDGASSLNSPSIPPSPEWCLVDLHRSPPLPLTNLESLGSKTLQYIGCWPSGKLALQPRLVAIGNNDGSSSSRGLGAAATDHL